MTRALLRLLALPVAALAFLGADASAMRFNGHWEVVHGRTDGRFAGASARSFHPGDSLEFTVDGSGFRIFGVTGPTGGHAVVLLADRAPHTIDFYSPAKRTHVLLYTSPALPPGDHTAAVVIVPKRDPQSLGNYVNIDVVDVIRDRTMHPASAAAADLHDRAGDI
jgi:galactosylceramidase